ncbi:hypothetical protein Tco_0033322 [Tanacetum coccineum]
MSDWEALNEQVAELARNLKQFERQIFYGQYSCSCCGGPYNDGNCPSCSMVGLGNGFVYDQNPYSYNETPNFFNQPPQHQIETYSCEFYGGRSHHGFDCQTRNTLVYEQVPYDNQNYGLKQHPYYSPSPPQQFYCCEDVHSTQVPNPPVDLDTEESDDDVTEVIFDEEQFLRQQSTAHVTPSPLVYTPPPPCLATMEPLDALLMGDVVISTTPARDNDKFIKSSVDDLVLIPRESEVTSDSNLECDMPVNTPLPTTDVREENFDINSPLGEHVVDFLMENEDIADLPRHLV